MLFFLHGTEESDLSLHPFQPRIRTSPQSGSVQQVTRAYLIRVGEKGRIAWWIGGENQKAKIDLGAKKRVLAPNKWAVAQGTSSQVSVGAMSGMNSLDGQTPQLDGMLSKVVSMQTLGVPQIGLDSDVAKRHFFDLTDVSNGLLSSVRSGGLRKDLSLLLDRDNNNLPAPYRFQAGATVEPSIRPLSSDILAYNAKLPNRPFASWTAMKNYYRMYRTTSDLALYGNTGYHTGGKGNLSWSGSIPFTDVLSTRNFDPSAGRWTGENGYMRMPILAKLTFLHSIKTEPNPTIPSERFVRHLYSPIVTLWNPYTTELRFRSDSMGIVGAIHFAWPTESEIFKDGIKQPGIDSTKLGTDNKFRTPTGADIILKPGEFKLFSYSGILADTNSLKHPLYPGFDPSAIGGVVNTDNKSFPIAEINAQRIGLKIRFQNNWSWNKQNGQTPGSLNTGLIYGNEHWDLLPSLYQINWFNQSQRLSRITDQETYFSASDEPVLVGYTQLALKSLSQPSYESINWEQDWGARNWIQSPPFYFGNGLYMSENATTGHTQRLDSPYIASFGPISALELPKVVGHVGEKAFLGSGSNPYEKVTAVPALELPTAPISSLAGFSGMRMSPGWIRGEDLLPDVWMSRAARDVDKRYSMVTATSKRIAYQSGITGPGIGNSFLHPMIPRIAVYQFHNNSISRDQQNSSSDPVVVSDTRAYCDYWDHVFLLNDALWDDYYLSTLATQTRRDDSSADATLTKNIDRLVAGDPISNPRLKYQTGGLLPAQVKTALLAQDGYLKSAEHLMVDGAFNVNSTSVEAWIALFAGIRERKIHYRTNSGTLAPVEIPDGARIAISRFETPNSDKEVLNPSTGVTREDGNQAWTGIRFLTDEQLRLLAEKCVEQVKRRGPFVNFSEFINRRLSNDPLGTMGALQSAIDYDDSNPDPASINYRYKSSGGLMIKQSDLGTNDFQTPQAAEGARLAGVPGYVIQSDILNPIASTLTVRDDTFRIRTYGESLDSNGKVKARAWCEALVQRIPEYHDATNSPEVPVRILNASGDYIDNPALTDTNKRFGRKFEIVSFRWMNYEEI